MLASRPQAPRRIVDRPGGAGQQGQVPVTAAQLSAGTSVTASRSARITMWAVPPTLQLVDVPATVQNVPIWETGSVIASARQAVQIGGYLLVA